MQKNSREKRDQFSKEIRRNQINSMMAEYRSRMIKSWKQSAEESLRALLLSIFPNEQYSDIVKLKLLLSGLVSKNSSQMKQEVPNSSNLLIIQGILTSSKESKLFFKKTNQKVYQIQGFQFLQCLNMLSREISTLVEEVNKKNQRESKMISMNEGSYKIEQLMNNLYEATKILKEITIYCVLFLEVYVELHSNLTQKQKINHSILEEITQCLIELSCFRPRKFVNVRGLEIIKNVNEKMKELRQIISISTPKYLMVIAQEVAFHSFNFKLLTNLVYLFGNIFVSLSSNQIQEKSLLDPIHALIFNIFIHVLNSQSQQNLGNQIKVLFPQFISLIIWFIRNQVLITQGLFQQNREIAYQNGTKIYDSQWIQISFAILQRISKQMKKQPLSYLSQLHVTTLCDMLSLMKLLQNDFDIPQSNIWNFCKCLSQFTLVLRHGNLRPHHKQLQSSIYKFYIDFIDVRFQVSQQFNFAQEISESNLLEFILSEATLSIHRSQLVASGLRLYGKLMNSNRLNATKKSILFQQIFIGFEQLITNVQKIDEYDLARQCLSLVHLVIRMYQMSSCGSEMKSEFLNRQTLQILLGLCQIVWETEKSVDDIIIALELLHTIAYNEQFALILKETILNCGYQEQFQILSSHVNKDINRLVYEIYEYYRVMATIYTLIQSLLNYNKLTMSEPKELKELKDFATGNKVRDIIGQEMAPIVQKIVGQCSEIRNEMNRFKDNFKIVLKFDGEKQALQKNVQEMSQKIAQLSSQLIILQQQFETNKVKNVSQHSIMKQDILRFQRTLLRRDEAFLGYDKKISGISQNVSRFQLTVNQRLSTSEQKMSKLSKDTLQTIKDIKREFDGVMINNQALKNQLLNKMKNNEQSEKILGLYMAQREEIAQKILTIEQKITNFAQVSEFQQFKRVQQGFAEDNYSKIVKFMQAVLPIETQENIKLIKVKFAQLEELKLKNHKIEQELKLQLKLIHQNVRSIEASGNQKIQQIRIQQEEVEEKLIEEMDKRFQTIEDHLQQRGTQTQESIDQKIRQLRRELQQNFNHTFEIQAKQISDLKVAKQMQSEISEGARMILEELQLINEQRQKLSLESERIRMLADGLNEKLTIFSNRITTCRSDIQLFTDTTRKQLRRINVLKSDLINNMENIGKILASAMESIMILTAIEIGKEKHRESNVFVTFNDGIVLEIDPKISQQEVIYRRNHLKVKNLKESLLYNLINIIDEHILDQSMIKWDSNPPSYFFQSIKANMKIKSKEIVNCQTIPVELPQRNQSCEQVAIIDFKKEGDEFNRQLNFTQKSRVTLNTTNNGWPLKRFNSEMQKRSQMKKPSQVIIRMQPEDKRHCFTSRSRRRARINDRQ